jgi:hypothetical protein
MRVQMMMRTQIRMGRKKNNQNEIEKSGAKTEALFQEQMSL